MALSQIAPAVGQEAGPVAGPAAGTQPRGTQPEGTLEQVATAAAPAAEAVPADAPFDLTAWTPPDPETAGPGPFGDAVRAGARLMNETYAVIGPEVSDPAKRYAGNNLACTNCHEAGGTKPYAMPLVGITGQFPQFRARGNAVATLEDRVNGCMQRSMNGKALPLDSPEMKAFLAYFTFISRGVPVGAKLTGAGTQPMDLPDRAADPKAGAHVYAEVCASCHGENGEGQRNGEVGDAQGYAFPPVAGPDSFNDGAGMFRLWTATRFIHANMPQGTDHTSPVLTPDQAYDVAAYVESLPRPQRAGNEKDFPDRLKKPFDSPFPPFADPFPAEQHKFGPFGPIQDWLKQAQAKADAEAAAAEPEHQ